MPDATADSTTDLFPDDTTPAPQKPKQWGGDPRVPQGHGTFTNPDPVQVSPVRLSGTSSSGKTSVDTPSMEAIANHIETLIPYVQRAQTAVSRVSVAPGAFYHANLLRTKVMGSDGQGGLKDGCEKTLTDVANGLTDFCTGLRAMSKKYQTIEEANKMKADDVQNYMADATPDFNAVPQDMTSTS